MTENSALFPILCNQLRARRADIMAGERSRKSRISNAEADLKEAIEADGAADAEMDEINRILNQLDPQGHTETAPVDATGQPRMDDPKA